MDTHAQRQKRQNNVVSSLDVAIEALNLAEKLSSVTPAKAVFSSVSALLAMIRVGFLLFCDVMFQVHKWLGIGGQRAGVCRARIVLCRHL